MRIAKTQALGAASKGIWPKTPAFTLMLFKIKVRVIYKIEFKISRKSQKEVTDYWYIKCSFLHLTVTFVSSIHNNFITIIHRGRCVGFVF